MSDSINKNESQFNSFSKVTDEESKSNNPGWKNLLTDENFKRLIRFQDDIFAVLEMTPSFRKIINSLITEENLSVLQSRFLKDGRE